jgi:hypothetical protein
MATFNEDVITRGFAGGGDPGGVHGAVGAVVLDAFSNKWIKFSSKNSP